MTISSPIHVLHVMEATAGGSRHHLRYLVHGLRAAGVAVDLVLSGREADPDFAADLRGYSEAGCWVRALHMEKAPGLGDLALVRQLAAIIRERRPQIVHSHCAKAGLVARLAARRVDREIRTVHTPHSYFFQNMAGLSLSMGVRLERWLGRRTDLLLAISESEREVALCHRLIPDARIVVAPNGLPADFADRLRPRADVRAELGIPDEAVAIAVMSRLVARKGLRLLPDAIAAVPAEQRRRLRVYLYGDGPQRAELQAHVLELQLGVQIEFLGYRPEAARDWLGFDMGVTVSHYEGLSYQLLETLAAGRPLVATEVPGNLINLPDNPIVYIPRADPTALAKAISELMDDGPRRAELAAYSPGWVAQHFSLEQQIATTLAAYERLVAGSVGHWDAGR